LTLPPSTPEKVFVTQFNSPPPTIEQLAKTWLSQPPKIEDEIPLTQPLPPKALLKPPLTLL
jgi:hypothetical protein